MQTIPPFSKNKGNPLLTKDDVGKSKPNTYNLPSDQFTYGKSLQKDKEGAKEVSMTWKFHEESQDKQPSRDFTKLNKMSLQNGLYTSNQFYDFRRGNDARVNVKKGTNALPIELPEEEFRYGRKNRQKIRNLPSTPMKLVMGNTYGLEGEQQILEVYKYRSESQESKVRSQINVRQNKASTLFSESNHQKLAIVEGKEPFKLSKFKNVAPRTNTHLMKEHKNDSQYKVPSQMSNLQEQ